MSAGQDVTKPFEEFRRAEEEAAAGSSDAMIWLANHYESGVRGGPEPNGHKALCFYMAAFRREPDAWNQVMGRVVSDMAGYFNPISPDGGVRYSPLSDEMREKVKEQASFTINLFPELARFKDIAPAMRDLALEAALGLRDDVQTVRLKFGDWREAIELASRKDVPAQLRI